MTSPHNDSEIKPTKTHKHMFLSDFTSYVHYRVNCRQYQFPTYAVQVLVLCTGNLNIPRRPWRNSIDRNQIVNLSRPSARQRQPSVRQKKFVEPQRTATWAAYVGNWY